LVGQGVVRRLKKSGHDIRVIDRKTADLCETGVDYVHGDITDFQIVRDAARGMEAIVHLAAYTYPGAAAGAEIFRLNCTGTYNVFESAAQEGIQRVALASSINALGFNFGVVSFPIRYFPVDEDHPTCTTDPYSFSKQTSEAIAAYYWRRDGISSTCLRMPLIYSMEAGGNFAGWGRMVLEISRTAIDRLMAMDEGERAAWLDRMQKGLADIRAARASEHKWDFDADLTDPKFFAYLGYTDFWTILSVEDAAKAFEQSLLAPFEGSHAFYVTERENAAGVESEVLLNLFYPQVIERKQALPGFSPLVSCERARALIGFAPEYLVRERMG
jgi:UDP-glucose 4-epimerase